MKRSPKRPGTKRFDRAPQANIPRSSFDLSHPYKTTFDSGFIIPYLVEEIVPGDSFSVRTTSFIRLATPLHPTMDNLWVESFYFFVPNRLVWDNWQKFMGEQDDPGDSTDFLVPQIIDNTQFELGSMGDHFGLPTETPVFGCSAIPFRGMALIFNEWFRDQNLQNSINFNTGDGPDGIGAYEIQRRGKRKDYLSSSLPFPQKGPGVDLPLGDSAPVYHVGDTPGTQVTVELGQGSGDFNRLLGTPNVTVGPGDPDLPDQLRADLTNATAGTINDLRQAFQIQKLQERDARGGTRYTEIIKSHFQVTSPDARLQRPEYLGGGISSVQMNTVPQTSETQAATPQGNLTAYGTATVQGHGFSKSFVEHGYVIGMFSVRADLNYQNKMDRHWSRLSKYDFYWPALQALGEQPVYNKEIWYDNADGLNDNVWGYQERWSEMRQNLGQITGLFRSSAAESLDPWHYALDFQTRPALDDVFVEDTPPVKRTIAVQDEPEFLMDTWHQIRAARPMPIYSVPGYIDHF